MSRSSKGILIPFCDDSALIFASSSAVSPVIGYTGTVDFRSSRKARRALRRSDVSARWTPWASSATLIEQRAASRSPILAEMCFRNEPRRGVAALLRSRRWNRVLLPGGRVPWLAAFRDPFGDIFHEAFIRDSGCATCFGQCNAL